MESFLVKCSSCGTSNRIPADREGVHGRCGNCRSALPALQSPKLSARFAVSGIPVVHLLHKGKTVDQLAGAQTADSVVNWFRRRQRG